MEKEEIFIGNSDYSRKQMENGEYDRFLVIGDADSFLAEIAKYEKLGYEIKFKTSFFRKLFGITVYSVVAIKNKSV